MTTPGRSRYIISPHLDDAIFSIGGYIASLANNGDSVTIVTVFSHLGQLNGNAFQRHLDQKWKGMREAGDIRIKEDIAACERLRVKFEHWPFPDAAIRTFKDGSAQFLSLDAINADIADLDPDLISDLISNIHELAKAHPEGVFYFPAGISRHIDHRLVFRCGLDLHERGVSVRFYEDWPYASYSVIDGGLLWQSEIVPADLNAKLDAILCYGSQVYLVGGARARIKKELLRYAGRFKRKEYHERLWFLPENKIVFRPPLRQTSSQLSIRMAIRSFIPTLSWRGLDELFPAGKGACFDLGCGAGVYQKSAQRAGYQWIGLDLQRTGDRLRPFVRGDIQRLPFRNKSADLIIVSQVFEYLPQIDPMFSSLGELLDDGGTIVGSVSFMEPVHGVTFTGLSHNALHYLLRRDGFADIRILPGINGFVLMAWTFGRKVFGGWFGAFAALGMKLLLSMFVLPVLVLSGLLRRIGVGDGFLMIWLSKSMPLEFAGHLIFSARKDPMAKYHKQATKN